MPDESSEMTLFERLKNRRIGKGIEVKEIARQTHVSLKYLQALEAGQLEQIPDVYRRFFFQSYLAFFKYEDQDALLDEFKRLTEKQTDPAIPVMTEQQATQKTWQRYLIFAPLGLFVLIVVLLIWKSTGVETKKVRVEELPISVAVEELVGKPLTKPDSVAKSDTSVWKGVNVQILAKQRAWVQAIKDHKDTTEYMLETGNQASIKADSVLNFVIGNAGGVQFTINGVKMGAVGQNGEVISSMKITSRGIVDKKIRKLPKKEADIDTTHRD
jgi:transcriptional regulator with XRE-family HTH domain